MIDFLDIGWRGNRVSRIVLGTAQLGQPYGIANVVGQPTEAEALRIITGAWGSGIRFFDTAQAYGTSEAVLGLALRRLGVDGKAKVITKLSPGLMASDAARIQDAIGESRDKLGVPQLWAVMLHRASMLGEWPKALGKAMLEAKDEGSAQYLGVSVYSAEEARRALEHPDVDLIQAPCSAWDQRILVAGVLDLASASGKLCFVRSIYLQGLLTMSPQAVAERLPIARRAAEKWHEVVDRLGLTVKQAAVRFALSLGTPLVVGAETPEQTEETASLAVLEGLDLDTICQIREKMEPALDDRVLNPSTW